MVNILISGYYGFDNIGDESILRTLVSSLREHIPDCSLTVLSHNPASTREKYGVEAVDRMVADGDFARGEKVRTAHFRRRQPFAGCDEQQELTLLPLHHPLRGILP